MVGGALAWVRALPAVGALEVRRGRELQPSPGYAVLMKTLEQGLGGTSSSHHRAAEQMCVGTGALSRAS